MSRFYPIIKPLVVVVVVDNQNRGYCDPDCQFNSDGLHCNLFCTNRTQEDNGDYRRCPMCVKAFGYAQTTYKMLED